MAIEDWILPMHLGFTAEFFPFHPGVISDLLAVPLLRLDKHDPCALPNVRFRQDFGKFVKAMSLAFPDVAGLGNDDLYEVWDRAVDVVDFGRVVCIE